MCDVSVPRHLTRIFSLVFLNLNFGHTLSYHTLLCLLQEGLLLGSGTYINMNWVVDSVLR